MRHPALLLILFIACVSLSAPRAQAQASQLDDGPAPPPGAIAPATAPAPEAEVTPAAPVWDPLRAAKSMEVGAFYLKTGKYDAAIDRFEEAARVQPGLAKPYLMLGKTYDKKRDPKNAVSSYQKYLEVYPAAPDRSDVLKEIARQTGRIPKQTKPSPSR